MPKKSDDTVYILEGTAVLFKRPLTPHWQVRFKAKNKWQRVTTKTEDLDEAKKKAVEIVQEALFRDRLNMPVVNKKFKSVAQRAIQRMEDLTKRGQGKASFKHYIQALNNYLIPFLGNHNIDRIDGALLNELSAWRVKKMNLVPKASTINNHNAALNRVFDEAIASGYLTRVQVPDIRNDGLETEKRPTFTADEYNTLHRKLRVWVAQAREGNETLMRQKLRDYIFVLANTGIRPGTESMNLKWSSVFTYEKNGVRYLAMKVKGKTRKEREVTARHSVFRYMDRLRKLNPKWEKGSFEEFLSQRHNEYIFRVNGKDAQTAFGRMFARFLEDAGLLVDKVTGKHRTLYSLRHLYATFALTRGELSVYQLAKHMGTSVAMIEAHYGQLLLRDIADKIAGDKELLVERAEREKPAAKKKIAKTA